jgi:hypothetical protein
METDQFQHQMLHDELPVDDKLKFISITRSIIYELDADPVKKHSIVDLHHKYNIRRRRLYDLVNVFAAVGCATRESSTIVLWNGTQQILPNLFQERTKRGIINSFSTLRQLFPSSDCVGLASLSMALLMMFPAIGIFIINLRQLSSFFASETHKFKTTLCKLYQITLILGALGITAKTEQPCEVCLNPPFTQIIFEPQSLAPERMFAIQNIINTPYLSEQDLQKRREEFTFAISQKVK